MGEQEIGMSVSKINSESANKTVKKVIIIAAIIVVILVAFMIWQRFNVTVPRQDVMDIAIAHVGGGTATTPELDWEIWRWVWNLEVWHDGLVHELYINSRTGEIISHEIDRQ
jgi:uncharacterized membrane protein YkoI